MKFNEFDLNDTIQEAISYMGFEKATPIQESAIPVILENKDLIACAQTGTGKTAAFILPILDRIARDQGSGTSTLVLAPTRELAIQIEQHVQGFAYFTNASSIAIYGGDTDGMGWVQQKKALTKGADIIVATPGKLIAHLNMGYVKFDDIKFFILDEADRMLDIGFYEDILKIESYLPKNRQTLMFSATMPPEIRKLASKILNDPAELNTAIAKPPKNVLQAVYMVYEEQKIPLINDLIADKPDYKSILIFSSTKKKVTDIVRSLKKEGLVCEGISSDLEQLQRQEVLLRFKSRETRVLVATDVLSRGIDIQDINLVINFDVPNDAEDYVHRIGRTARAEKDGVALTFVTQNDTYDFHKIEKLIEQEVIKLPPPKDLGEGPAWEVKHRRKSSFKRRKFSGGRKKRK
ncbi:MAG: DEAD/DEAH box helicase [Bacteroidales bacterium]|nr:DEAD/DEAH box helicase [Bacteroidales bacterium]MCF8387387.1 DEAD/DEAH box helicase [Bacteroidales bacterium]MCF8398687.1 DEAD/DEAH box helicase [Bacteroidales bacterium]